MNIDHDLKLSACDQAILVSVVSPNLEGHQTEKATMHSLSELRELLRTLGIEAVGQHYQIRPSLTAGTVIGQGKLQEIADDARAKKVKVLVFDFELTASQARNLQQITKLDIIDRNYVILEIFARHARTREAKIQIEMARLQYLLPRLSDLWAHFSKKKGGIGQKGEGEQQLELDRRMIRKKIAFYKNQLAEMNISRQERKKRRQQTAIAAALVGYTNAGKSSLLNSLCREQVLAENKLFATLDSTVRAINPDTHPPMIIIDTVGFISNLPSSLFEGFKSTLESVIEADLLLITCDISDPHYQKQLEVTYQVLKELGVDQKQQFIIFNKKDLLNDHLQEKIIKRTHPNSFVVSAHNPDDMGQLRTKIVEYFLSLQEPFDLLVPYASGELHSLIRSKTNILATGTYEKGIFYRIKVPNFLFEQLPLRAYLLAPGHPYQGID